MSSLVTSNMKMMKTRLILKANIRTTINNGSASFSSGRNCAMMMIVTLKDELLLFAFPLSTGTRIIANWLNNRAVHSMTFNAKPYIPWDNYHHKQRATPAISALWLGKTIVPGCKMDRHLPWHLIIHDFQGLNH